MYKIHKSLTTIKCKYVSRRAKLLVAGADYICGQKPY